MPPGGHAPAATGDKASENDDVTSIGYTPIPWPWQRTRHKPDAEFVGTASMAVSRATWSALGFIAGFATSYCALARVVSTFSTIRSYLQG